jgi:hypothetical protein
MAAIDPYALCPCGSGEKFKWCCQKAEPYADKAIRLFENHQYEPSLTALDEGLAKFPGNVWLTLRKAMLLVELDRSSEALGMVEAIVARYPGQVAAQTLLVRLRLETQGLRQSIDQLQNALTTVAPAQRPALSGAARLVGMVLARMGVAPAAHQHLQLARNLQPEQGAETIASLERSLEANDRISPWLRDDWTLTPTPAGLGDEDRWRFDQALQYARDGLWSSAAASFDALELNGVAGADRNLALCRLWLADLNGAAEAARRASRRLGDTTEAVDLEALAQIITPPSRNDLVEQVHLIWTLRDRDGLLKSLAASDRTDDAGEEPLDPNDEKSFPVRVFEVLDRPRLANPARSTTDVADWPRILGRALVGREIALLETYDDGRLDSLSNWFTGLAGAALPPSQPRTKVLGEIARSELALRTELWMPSQMSQDDWAILQQAEADRVLTVVWPETPEPFLNHKSLRQAASEPQLRVAVRAALLRNDVAALQRTGRDTVLRVRDAIGVPPEPAIDTATVDVANVPLGRLHLINASRLDDHQLAALFRRAMSFAMLGAARAAALVLVERPGAMEKTGIGLLAPYTELALSDADRGDGEAAMTWAQKGRQADPASRGVNSIDWDLLDLKIQIRTESPESWVPRLAVALERYGNDESSMSKVLQFLVGMGLVQLMPHPEQPGSMLMDNRPLLALLAEYGPRITTAAGGLGVSASQGGIWTPGQSSPAGGATTKGGIWTPGAGNPSSTSAGAPSAPAGDKPRIIIPGR